MEKDKNNTKNAVQNNEDTQKDKYLTFPIGKETYGIEISKVIEIIGIQPITKVPRLPEYIVGIINLRGRIIPVINVRLRFGKEILEYDDRTCIIVIENNNVSIGLIVDSVTEVVNIPEKDIVKSPNMNNKAQKYVKIIGKVNDDIKLILDCDELMNYEETSE